MAILFVPFAIDESSPRKIKTGRVSVEPPPAVTFRNPAIIPTKKRIITDSTVSISKKMLYNCIQKLICILKIQVKFI